MPYEVIVVNAARVAVTLGQQGYSIKIVAYSVHVALAGLQTA